MFNVIENIYWSDWFTVIDLKYAYCQIVVDENYRFKTEFKFKNVIHEGVRMPMRYKNASSISRESWKNIKTSYRKRSWGLLGWYSYLLKNIKRP